LPRLKLKSPSEWMGFFYTFIIRIQFGLMR